MQAVFLLEEAKFPLELLRPVVFEVPFEQSGLAEEECFYLQGVFVVAVEQGMRQGEEEVFERICICRKAKSPCYAGAEHLFEVVLGALGELFEMPGFFFEAFDEHAVEPGGAGEWRDFGYAGGAGHFQGGLLELAVALEEAGGGAVFEFEAGQAAAIGQADGDVFFPDYVQDDVLIGGIEGVFVGDPIGGFDVDFDLPGPEAIAYAYARLQEIGAGMHVVDAALQDLDGRAVGGEQIFRVKAAGFPEEVQKFFGYALNFHTNRFKTNNTRLRLPWQPDGVSLFCSCICVKRRYVPAKIKIFGKSSAGGQKRVLWSTLWLFACKIFCEKCLGFSNVSYICCKRNEYFITKHFAL